MLIVFVCRVCGPGYTCLGMIGENPDDGWTSFDNFFKSMLTTFQLITLDYWERLYDLVRIYGVFFYIIMIFYVVGSRWLANCKLVEFFRDFTMMTLMSCHVTSYQ